MLGVGMGLFDLHEFVTLLGRPPTGEVGGHPSPAPAPASVLRSDSQKER